MRAGETDFAAPISELSWTKATLRLSELPQTAPALGAHVTPEGVRFNLWSTSAQSAAVRLFNGTRLTHPLARGPDGVFTGVVGEAGPGTLYKFVLDDREVPDPYARALPHGVHGPARVVASGKAPPRFHPARFADWVIYELHIGTFTAEGTYAAAEEKLPYLSRLGITAIELMPISSFAGQRGWGYDGVAHFAPFAPYGSDDELLPLHRGGAPSSDGRPLGRRLQPFRTRGKLPSRV